MSRIFKKGYAINDIYYEKIELEDSEIEGMTEEEIVELADERLWEKALTSTEFFIVDEIMIKPEEIK